MSAAALATRSLADITAEYLAARTAADEAEARVRAAGRAYLAASQPSHPSTPRT